MMANQCRHLPPAGDSAEKHAGDAWRRPGISTADRLSLRHLRRERSWLPVLIHCRFLKKRRASILRVTTTRIAGYDAWSAETCSG